MLRFFALGSVAAALVAAALPAQAGDVTKDPGDRRICKIFEQTGSRLAKNKVCMTRREWKQEEDEQARELRDNQDAGVKTSTDTPRAPAPR